MGEFVGYEQLLSTLRQHVRDGVTGTLFIRTETNRSAMVGFRNGEIVMLSCGMQRGLDAVAEIRAIQAGSHRLAPNSVDMGSASLPPTAELLALLEAAAGPSPGPSPAPAAPAPGGYDAGPAVAALKALFVEFIGPIGPMVFDDVRGRLGTPRRPEDLEQLVNGLASELGGAAEAARFKQAARQRLT